MARIVIRFRFRVSDEEISSLLTQLGVEFSKGVFARNMVVETDDPDATLQALKASTIVQAAELEIQHQTQTPTQEV